MTEDLWHWAAERRRGWAAEKADGLGSHWTTASSQDSTGVPPENGQASPKERWLLDIRVAPQWVQ